MVVDPKTHLMTEATPPLRIVSACSVNAVSLERGHSRPDRPSFDVDNINASAGIGVRKNVRPTGV